MHALLAQRARDIADGDRAELRVFVRLESGVEEGKEGSDLGREFVFEGGNHCYGDEEGVFKSSRTGGCLGGRS